MNVIVFVGPSLDMHTASSLMKATFLPPCKMGDIYRACLNKPRAIIIIDGYFENTPAVWHKEILYALNQGIHVYGGSSMGALRAAELYQFGMIGAGEIFDNFASGTFEDDDEVAVIHSPVEQGFTCQSQAMVNIRFGIKGAIEKNILSSATGETLIQYAKKLLYPDRSWPTLFMAANKLGISMNELDKFKLYIETVQPDQKRDDAITTIKLCVRELEEGKPEHVPNFIFEDTFFWDNLRAECHSIDKKIQNGTKMDSV